MINNNKHRTCSRCKYKQCEYYKKPFLIILSANHIYFSRIYIICRVYNTIYLTEIQL